MAFSPDNITKKHVLDAVKNIESENIQLEPSTGFDVVIDGKPYPPKEVMRYAHELMNGEHIWERIGGEPTNKYLIALGFEIKSKSDSLTNEQPITGNIWKLGCNWDKGKPSFYKIIKDNEIVIGVEEKKYSVGDLILITEGFNAMSIAKILQSPQLLTDNQKFQEPFEKLSIPFEDRINISYVEWYELEETERFTYQLQAGIRKIQDSKVKQKVIDLWNSRNSNYWIFQGNPNDFDFETAIRENLLEEWTVSAHKDKIKVGDKVILWISGKKSGCYALAEITSEPKIISQSKASHLWKTEDKNPLKAGIKITHNLIDNPITLEEIKRNKDLSELKVGNQGTNFSATKKEYNKILEMAQDKNIPTEARVIYAYLVKSMSHRNIQREILEKESPARGGGFLAMQILHDYEIRDDKKGVLLTTNFESEIISAKGKYLEALNLLKKYYSELSTNNQIAMQAKNMILYGPPGTGKTYNSIDKAVEIATGKSVFNHTENKKQFDELRKQGQIEFLTFHQNYSYEDFVVGLRPDVENEQLRFRTNRGIFYEISRRARENYYASREKTALARSFDEVFNEIIKPVAEEGKGVEIIMVSGVKYRITDVSDTTIHFEKPSGGTQHTLSIQTLEDVVNDVKEVTSGLSVYYNPLANIIKEKRKPIQGSQKEEEKSFVLVIDEINRANISKVFGELITLLEDDKRLGEENEIKITLPNGEKEFGVPPNLYIIGTMNTADKSIALIDIALRRRFEFIGYYPEYENLNDEEAILLKKINETIFKEKKSADYLIGHAYFMKGQTIKTVLQNKVVPLLMEYFSGKTDIVSKIFVDTSWSVTYNTTNFIWDITPR
ncbi:MAG: EVE domain-containing protein [Bacteroidota bacterium]|nr:EVE domain-containing protein [Bacteroidota bacterium]